MVRKKKPKLDDLMKGLEAEPEKPKPTTRRKRARQRHKYKDNSDNTDIEMMRVWIPHFIASDFNRERSIALAFPTLKQTKRQRWNLAYQFITHPMFTDLIASHIEKLESELASSERYVLDRLYRQAEANIFDYFSADDYGNLKVVKLTELPKWMQQNVKKLKVTNDIVEHGLDRRTIRQTVDMEIVDSFKPVQLLGKHMGMFIERVEHTLGKDTADRLEAALEKAKQRRLDGEQHRHQRVTDKSRDAGSVH